MVPNVPLQSTNKIVYTQQRPNHIGFKTGKAYAYIIKGIQRQGWIAIKTFVAASY